MSSTNKKPRRPIPKKEGNPEFREDDGYNSLIKEGEEFEQDGNIESAINKFKEASSLRPEEEYPKDKIESLKEKSNEGSNNGLFDDLGPDDEFDFEDGIGSEDEFDFDDRIAPDDNIGTKDNIGSEDEFGSNDSIEPVDNIGPDDRIGPVGDPLKPKREDTFVYHKNRSYFFIFGPFTSGKTVIISSIISYLNDYRNTEKGSTTICLNDQSVKHEKIGLELYNEVMEMQYSNQFPSGTLNIASRKQSSSGDVPGHIDLRYIENNQDDSFDFCMMDMAGEDLQNIKVEKDTPLPESIRTYIEDIPNDNMCFMYVLNPDASYHMETNAKKASLFNSFIQLLDSRGHTSTPILILVSKWDTIESQYDSASDYIRKEYPSIWGKASEGARNITITSFSYGIVEDVKPIEFMPKDAKKVFEWMYKTQHQGDSEDDHNIGKENNSFIKSILSKLRKKNG